jgi:DNA-binding IclR family transcriptional regulator
MQARIGRRDPIHTTEIGKAILTHLPQDLARQILPPRLRKRTWRTVCSAAAPTARLNAAMRQRMAPSLIDAARRISTTLGFRSTR